MHLNLARKLIQSDLRSGSMTPGREISIRIDQTLTQDAKGTMVLPKLEVMHLVLKVPRSQPFPESSQGSGRMACTAGSSSRWWIA